MLDTWFMTAGERVQVAVLQLLTAHYPPEALLPKLGPMTRTCAAYQKVEDEKQKKKYA